MRRLTPHFRFAELSCRCNCGRMDFTPEALGHLEQIRIAFGSPMYVTSGYRCPEHNDEVSTTGRNGPHTVTEHDNVAVDVLAYGSEARRLVWVLMDHGWTGIGVSQRGPRGVRFIHADRIVPGSSHHPRPWIWSY